jgi:hypothetical protein
MVESPALVVIQRQTVDWASISLEAFREQSRAFCRLWSKPEEYVWQLRDLWDQTFAMSYLQTRAAVKAQSETRINNVPGICFVPYQEYTNIPRFDVPYVFVDDDDWVSPTIATDLPPVLPDSFQAVLWRAVNIGSPQQETAMFVWGLNGRCMTNNYAMSGCWLHETGRLPDFIQHFDAIKALACLPPVQQFDLTVTATNKSPCSSVSLDRGLDGDYRPDKLITLVETFVEKMENVPDADLWQAPWVIPQVRDMTAIFKRVLDSRL